MKNIIWENTCGRRTWTIITDESVDSHEHALELLDNGTAPEGFTPIAYDSDIDSLMADTLALEKAEADAAKREAEQVEKDKFQAAVNAALESMGVLVAKA